MLPGSAPGTARSPKNSSVPGTGPRPLWPCAPVVPGGAHDPSYFGYAHCQYLARRQCHSCAWLVARAAHSQSRRVRNSVYAPRSLQRLRISHGKSSVAQGSSQDTSIAGPTSKPARHQFERFPIQHQQCSESHGGRAQRWTPTPVSGGFSCSRNLHY